MSELIFRQIEIGPMANYSYLIGSSASREAVLVDPAWDVAALRELVRKEGLSLTGILVTHTHFDHVGGEMSGQRIEGVPELLKLCAPDKPRLYVHPKEAGQIPDGGEERVETSDGFVLMLGGVAIEFIHTPGHSPGSQCFRVEGRLVSGDTLFIGSCGRTDLPGSRTEDLYDSLMDKLMKLDEDTQVFPGHNYSYGLTQSTIGREKTSNPYCRFSSKQAFLEALG